MEDRCVCCGEIVPEGRQVCWKCEHGDRDTIRGHRMTNLSPQTIAEAVNKVKR